MLIPMVAAYSEREGSYRIEKNERAAMCAELDTDFLSELWHTFFYGQTTMSFEKLSQGCVMTVGHYERASLNGYESVTVVSPEGIYLEGDSPRGLLHAFFTLMQMARSDGDTEHPTFSLPCCVVRDRPALSFRAIHLCVFPETELIFLRKCIRLCGMLKCSHIVLEFWGTYAFSCMKELAWKEAFTKAQIVPLLREASAMGIELIPMFNHLGHATQARMMGGKHVVLDQNPLLAPLFEEDGWTWKYENEAVIRLLSSVREEMMALFGPGGYFHLGFDEPYSFALPENRNEEKIKLVLTRLNQFTEELSRAGRRPIVWGDMFLSHDVFGEAYSCNAHNAAEAEILLAGTDRRVVVADWQYGATEAPVKTALYLQKRGFDVAVCPWKDLCNVTACTETAVKNGLLGVMYTTWNKQCEDFSMMLADAVCGWRGDYDFPKSVRRTMCAQLLRRLCPSHGDYVQSGWQAHQLHGAEL